MEQGGGSSQATSCHVIKDNAGQILVPRSDRILRINSRKGGKKKMNRKNSPLHFKTPNHQDVHQRISKLQKKIKTILLLHQQEPRSETNTAPHQKNPVTKKKTPHSNADTHRTPTPTQSRILHSKHLTSAAIIKFILPDHHPSRLWSTKGYKTPLHFYLKAEMGNTASSESVQNNVQGLVIEEPDITTLNFHDTITYILVSIGIAMAMAIMF